MNISLSESVEGRLNELLGYFNINGMEIKKLFASESIPVVLHKEEMINHIFMVENKPSVLIDKKLKNLLNITKLYLIGFDDGERRFRPYA